MAPPFLESGFPVRYCCELNAHWPAETYLPLPLRPQAPEQHQALFQLNPQLYWVRSEAAGGTPASWGQRMQGIGFSAQLPLLWVQHPLYDYPQAYWPDPDMTNWIHRLQQDPRHVTRLPSQVFQLLAAAHILVPPSIYLAERQARLPQWQSELTQARCTVLPGLISPLQMAALRRYTREARAASPPDQELSVTTSREYRYDDPVARYFHHQFPRCFDTLTGESLRPSYNLISYYLPASVLHVHVDRSPCIWNLSVALDHSPEVWGAERWPLDIWIEDTKREIRLNPGDGFLYRGRDNLHGRPPLPPGHTETVLLFHFVDAAYRGDLA